MSDTTIPVNSATHNTTDNTMQRTSDTLRPVVDHLMSGVHEAVERLADVASQAADKVELSGEYLKDSQERMAGSCRSYVRSRPLSSIGVALATGFVLSWALRQR